MTGKYHVPELDFVPERIVDAGANIGLTAAHYAKLWPDAQIVAVEMDADNCEMIRRNAPTVEVKNYAVSATGGWGTYDPSDEAEAYSFRIRGPRGNAVSSYRLRQIIRCNFTEGAVDFLKLDIEGEEWAILNHDLTAERPWNPLVTSLLVELHERNALAPPSGPWPEGRDGPSPLLAAAVPLLEALGYQATPRLDHPASVFAVRR